MRSSPIRPVFRTPDRVLACSFEDCFERLEFTAETYCVIVTRGHVHDKLVLQKVLEQPIRYIGMIGSRRKRNLIYDALMKEGVLPEQLERINSPIGVDIGAETPAEIAVSIAAEMIEVRGKHLRRVKEWKV